MAYDSVVITIRLNPNDPLEARALDYLRVREQDGYKARGVIGAALAAAAENHYQLVEIGEQQAEMTRLQHDTLNLLTQLIGDNVKLVMKGSDPDDPANEALTDRFKAGLNKMARPIQGLDQGDS